MKFIQYLRPDGRQRVCQIERSKDIEDLAKSLSHVRFEAEILTTGEVSLTAEIDQNGEADVLAQEICSNGPDVPYAVDRLVKRAHAAQTRNES